MKYHIAHDDGGFFIADEDHVEAVSGSYSTRKAAEKALEVWQAEVDQAHREADITDGYNRDDLGESPDY
ncbi:hypothetical protein LCGC14_2230310 [marine sediment metagenome]|uniref:DUF1508 domain-containing protein n=1 Tax=marine sediment metagenome TaxID=412755 RepID=A0A0F9FL17_9ZZZZ